MDNNKEIQELEQERESWEKNCLRKELEATGEWKKEFLTGSGIPVNRLYTPLDLRDRRWNYMKDLGFPGEYPFTRGISPTMYRGNIWAMVQYAGFGTAETTNEWFKFILDQGARTLLVAQDLPGQIGLDSDNPLSAGEVGKVGVAINSLEDIETIFDGISIQDISIGTAANATGPIFLAFILALAENRGMKPEELSLILQNDVLKEFISRNTYIFPPKPSLKFSCDVTEFCIKNGLKNALSNWFCGYHMREAGGNIIQELAFTLTNAVVFLEELASRGVNLNGYKAVATLVAGLDFFEEICKFRAFRRMFARMMKERFKVTTPISLITNGQASSYTAQQPMNNIVRGTITALVQALSGVQGMNIVGFDEAYTIPTPEAIRIGLRTQQIIAYESGVANTVDPLAGSYYAEALTDELEERANRLIEEVEALGGALKCIEKGFQQKEIAREAYNQLKQVKNGDKVVVGVNKYQVDERIPVKLMTADPMVQERQIEKLKLLKKKRDNKKVGTALMEIKDAAIEGVNLVSPILNAVKAYTTIGEICDILRDIYGEYRAPAY